MSQPRSARGQRPIDPATERQQLRWLLFDAFRQARRYQYRLAHDLRPLWDAVLDQFAEADLGGHAELRDGEEVWIVPEIGEFYFDELDHLAPELGAPVLDRYLDAVRATVKDTLRLTHRGKPTDWAADFLHGDIAGADASSLLADRSGYRWQLKPVDPSHEATLRIAIAPVSAQLALTVGGGRRRGFPNLVDADWPFLLDPTSKEFEDAILRALCPWLHEVRASLEGRYAGEVRRPSTRQRWPTSAHLLARYLLSGRIDPRDSAVEHMGLDAATQAARRMAKRIGIDFSIPRTTTRRKRR